MKPLLKLLYGLLALAVGVAVSWYLVSFVNAPRRLAPAEAAADSLFVDFIERTESYYADFRNQETHFHGVQRHHLLPLERQSSCLTCHDLYPHMRDPKRRAFNNQHGHFMTCLACHLDPALRSATSFMWSDFGVRSAVTEAGAYGLGRDGDGQLTNPSNLITRIVPVLQRGGDRTAVFTPYDDARHAAYRAELAGGGSPDREAFRRAAEEKVGGPALGCRDCHAQASAFPWSELGFSPRRVDELVQSSVVGMIEDYDSFQFPVND